MNKPVPKFRPIGGSAPLDVPDEELIALSNRLGVPSLVKPPPSPAPNAGEKPEPAAPSHAAQPPPSPLRAAEPAAVARVETEVLPPPEKLTFEVPVYLMQALRRDCAERRVTQRYLILLGLQAIGYKIEPSDLVPDHRRPQHKAGRP